MHRVLGMTTRLVARTRPDDASGARNQLTALTIIGQALVFRAARAAVRDPSHRSPPALLSPAILPAHVRSRSLGRTHVDRGRKCAP